MGRTLRLCAAAAAAFGVVAALAMAAPTNGGFEKGTFQGWERVDESGGDAPPRDTSTGAWQIYSGKLRLSEGPPPPKRGLGGEGPDVKLDEPPQGQYAAGLGSTGPGTHILHRVISVSGRQQLSLQLSYWNTAQDFYVQDYLSADPPFRRGGDEFSNQQLRIDLMEPDAPIASLESEDIVKTIFRTKPGDKRRRDYATVKAGVNAGEYRLRIAEVDNESNFFVGIDAVKLKDN